MTKIFYLGEHCLDSNLQGVSHLWVSVKMLLLHKEASLKRVGRSMGTKRSL